MPSHLSSLEHKKVRRPKVDLCFAVLPGFTAQDAPNLKGACGIFGDARGDITGAAFARHHVNGVADSGSLGAAVVSRHVGSIGEQKAKHQPVFVENPESEAA